MTNSAVTGTAPEPLLDLQGLVAGIRWRRRTWLTLALIGLILGGLSVVLLPTTATAVTRLYVVHETEQPGNVATLVETDIALLETTRIAATALAAIGSPQRPADFLDQYSVLAVAGNVIELTVRARTDEDAVARAQALADAFIADHVQRTETLTSAETAAFADRRADSEQQLTDVNRRITETVAGGPGAASAELESLYAEQGALVSQIRELGQRAEDASIGAPRVAAGTQIVDPPRPILRSRLVTGTTNAAVGLVMGLGIGIAVAAVASVVGGRPVLRRDIAANLGASVIVQLPAPRRRKVRRRSWRATERKRVAAALARIVRGAPGPVSLLEIGCPSVAAAIAVEVAEDLATTEDVAVVDDLPGRQVGRIARRAVAVAVVDGADYPAVNPGPQRHLGVGTLAPGTGWMDLARLGGETVLVVRAGRASTAWMHDVARQLAAADIVVIGIVLIHPDPRDRTDGTLWDGLHVALRGRRAPAGATAVDAGAPAVGEKQAGGPGPHRSPVIVAARNGERRNGNGAYGNGSSGYGHPASVAVLPAESFVPDVDDTPDKAVEDS